MRRSVIMVIVVALTVGSMLLLKNGILEAHFLLR